MTDEDKSEVEQVEVALIQATDRLHRQAEQGLTNGNLETVKAMVENVEDVLAEARELPESQ